MRGLVVLGMWVGCGSAVAPAPEQVVVEAVGDTVIEAPKPPRSAMMRINALEKSIGGLPHATAVVEGATVEAFWRDEVLVYVSKKGPAGTMRVDYEEGMIGAVVQTQTGPPQVMLHLSVDAAGEPLMARKLSGGRGQDLSAQEIEVVRADAEALVQSTEALAPPER